MSESETETGTVNVTEEDLDVYAICGLNDIPSQRARGLKLMRLREDGTEYVWPIIVVRWGKRVFGYENRCPHHGVNLDWERQQFLDSNGTRLLCGKHGALFDIGTGDCVEGPCMGDSLTPIALTVIENEICVVGVKLARDEDDEEEAAG
ncbi:MAG TPA: Rieske 2Fe-2S domain-containing protein [Methylocella sp.]|nr:Rieske 2Fe-2S domain-containing protein [Methylocella sp.]